LSVKAFILQKYQRVLVILYARQALVKVAQMAPLTPSYANTLFGVLPPEKLFTLINLTFERRDGMVLDQERTPKEVWEALLRFFIEREEQKMNDAILEKSVKLVERQTTLKNRRNRRARVRTKGSPQKKSHLLKSIQEISMLYNKRLVEEIESQLLRISSKDCDQKPYIMSPSTQLLLYLPR
jgi:hypothetical protein